jgi:molybdopterin-guanine dinucleotide biosynthesis protein A
MVIQTQNITGLVLAGGRGSRMGGVDKGLQAFGGATLVQNAAARLAPQVGRLMINANRNLEAYAALGHPVWPDDPPDFAGPLAGMLAGLEHCTTDYLVTVPCDTPHFPQDLVSRLSIALSAAGAVIAVAHTRETDAPAGRLNPQPVFCLAHVSLRDGLRAFIAGGERKTGLWSRGLRNVAVEFAESEAFFNVNTLEELARADR